MLTSIMTAISVKMTYAGFDEYGAAENRDIGESSTVTSVRPDTALTANVQTR